MKPSRGSTAVEPWALTALFAWLLITVGWWALALWPLPGESPEWLTRARSVCFNTTETGLPDASGWLLLIGQPIGMLGILVVGWPDTVRSTFAGLAARGAGRVALLASGAVVVAGLLAAGVRVADARAASIIRIQPDATHPEGQPRDGSMPAGLDLVDQTGQRVSLEAFRGRPVLLTFAFGHCETVCPVVVRNANTIRNEMGADERPALLVVTLDPWRDTPARLGHLAGAWELGDDGFVLGGSVEDVNATLDAWEIQRSRDGRTGDIIHAPVVFVIDRDGRIAFVSTGEIRSLAELLERL